MGHSTDHQSIGRVGNLLNPLLFVVLGVAAFLAWRRGTLRDSPAVFAARVAVSALVAWLLVHPQKLWHGFPRDFNTSAHAAFFLVPAIALCFVNAKWARLLVPLGVGYALFMVALRFHTPLEIALTSLVVAPLVWLCHAVGRRRGGALLNSPA